MFKLLCITFLLTGSNFSLGSIIKAPSLNNFEVNHFPDKIDSRSKWESHAMDFLKLIDLEKVVSVIIDHLYDPEVLNFLNFVLGPEFKELVWEFEMMDEFKEAFVFLEAKGYDVQSAIDFINSNLNLPPFDVPSNLLRDGKGITAFIEDLIATLPVDDIKKLFEEKIHNNKEIADLYETITSDEFKDILQRMAKSPKFVEFKIIFEVYGFDFKYLCRLAKELLGNYYMGIFCE